MARPASTTLSLTHRKIANAILVIERGGFPATISELVGALRLAGASSLVPTLRVMERNGFVSIHGGGAQGRDHLVKMTSKGRYAMGEGGIPVLGTIRAGVLEEAIAEPETVLEPGELLPYRPGDFLLKVRGDSMIGDGIFAEDHVLLRPDVAVQQGEIAAVLVSEEGGAEYGGEYAGECEATLKRVYQEGERVRLVASNPHYADQVVSAGAVKIAGVFRGLIRHAESL